jgi:hypothetical protein
MSVKVKSSVGSAEFLHGGILQKVAAVLGILKCVALIAFAVCMVAFIFTLVDGKPSSAACFVLWATCMGLYFLILRSTQIVLQGGTNNDQLPAPFAKSASKQLKIIAVCFFVLTFAEFVFSAAACLLQTGAFPHVSFTFTPAGFPTEAVWQAIFNGTYEQSVLHTAPIDFALIIAGGVAWALSYVFEFGAQLQLDNEETI